jgi:hypothetical protein
VKRLSSQLTTAVADGGDVELLRQPAARTGRAGVVLVLMRPPPRPFASAKDQVSDALTVARGTRARLRVEVPLRLTTTPNANGSLGCLCCPTLRAFGRELSWKIPTRCGKRRPTLQSPCSLSFEPHRWCLYEIRQASHAEEETVEGLRKLKGGRCRGW